MAVRFAYWIKDRSVSQVLDAPPPRIVAAWPNDPANCNESWMAHAHPSGVGTLLVFPKYDGAAAPLSAFGAPRDTHDGMVFYPSLEKPTADWLIRPEHQRPLCEWIATRSGLQVHVAIAFATARKLIMPAGGGYRLGDPVGEFGRLGHELIDPFFANDGLPFTDARIWRLLFLAFRESYWMTEEILEEWLNDSSAITDADVNPIIACALGAGPKRLADARAASLSSAQTTATSP